MKAPRTAKAPSNIARQSAALERARTALPEASEPQRLRTALLEAAAERLANDPAFAARVRERYAEGGQAAKAKAKAPGDELPPLVPVGHVPGMKIDLAAPPNPRELNILYGHHQLARALQDYTLDSLKRAADIVQQQHPGTKPTNRGRKDAVIAYIVEHTPAE